MFRQMSWAPTIALTRLWGVSFFFSFQITLTNGVLGFLVFALASVCGILVFGWVIGDPKRDPAAIFGEVQGRFTGLFLACQVTATAITFFASAQYLFIPLFGPRSIVVIVIITLLAVAIGHTATMQSLKRLHIFYLAVGLGAAATLFAGVSLGNRAVPVTLASFDGRFYGLVLPILVGFALGPWTDVRHWQRVIAIRGEGTSVRLAYTWGMALFLTLICLNAAIAAAAGPVMAIISVDGLRGLQPSVAAAVAGSGLTSLQAAFVVWAGIALASTLDSFYCTTRWLLRSTVSASTSPLLAFLPVGMVTSPIWALLTAALIALAMVVTNVSMLYLMVLYATLLAGPAACLLCESISGRRHYDGMLCMMIGAAAFLIFVIGYVGDTPSFMAISPLIALIGAFSAIKACFKTPPEQAEPRSQAMEAVSRIAPPQMVTINVAVHETVLGHGFDGQWFYLNITPTYDDTNSVGNVYFANYFRWIGKTRELFFNACMPDFDLQTTDFYVLTKSFAHEFRREIREFQPVSVRVRIGSYNRKFVTIVHEIHSRTDGVIGRGEQTIMFVDKTHYRPLDIPAIILQRFLPYYTPNAPRRPAAVAAPQPA